MIPVAGPVNIDQRWGESLYRAYLQMTPHSQRWAIEIEYSKEKFNNFESFGPRDTETQTIPLSISYFAPSGFFAKLRSSYLNQKVRLNTGSESDSATFLDLSLGYRLPKRLGIFEVQLQNMLNQNYRYEGLQNRSPRSELECRRFYRFRPILPSSFVLMWLFRLNSDTGTECVRKKC